MSDNQSHSLAGVVHRRWECFCAIVEKPRSKRALVEHLETPRSTLDDIVRELERAELVTYVDGRWRVTTIGRYTHQAYDRFLGSIDGLEELGSVLEPISEPEDVDPAMLNGAEAFEATGSVPDAVLDEFLVRVSDADHIKGVAPRAIAGYADSVQQRADDGDTTLELVLANDVYEQLSKLYDIPGDDQDTTLYRTEVPFEFGLWVSESPAHAGLVVYTDHGIKGILINDSERAVEWAIDQYQRVRDGAIPITEEAVDASQS